MRKCNIAFIDHQVAPASSAAIAALIAGKRPDQS
jgi:hypothetical protein